jgi:hypothetical protein
MSTPVSQRRPLLIETKGFVKKWAKKYNCPILLKGAKNICFYCFYLVRARLGDFLKSYPQGSFFPK